MRASEIINDRVARKLRTYIIKLKLRQPGGSTQIMDTMVQARNPNQARKMIQAQYSSRNVIIGSPREVKFSQ